MLYIYCSRYRISNFSQIHNLLWWEEPQRQSWGNKSVHLIGHHFQIFLVDKSKKYIILKKVHHKLILMSSTNLLFQGFYLSSWIPHLCLLKWQKFYSQCHQHYCPLIISYIHINSSEKQHLYYYPKQIKISLQVFFFFFPVKTISFLEQSSYWVFLFVCF